MVTANPLELREAVEKPPHMKGEVVIKFLVEMRWKTRR